MAGTHEGGGMFPCGQRRPSEHSMMRWIGFDFDQIGLEHMVPRVTGLRNSGQMNVQNTPTTGTVAKDGVLWVESGHPRFHPLDVTWRIGGPAGTVIAAAQNSRNLDLEPLNLAPGTVVWAEVRDPVGPSGTDWVRDPSANNAATDSGFNGSRFVQTRTWTVGDTTVTASPARSSTKFIPGFGTHTVEHRAIDPAGNYSTPESYKATVLPGGSPACSTTRQHA